MIDGKYKHHIDKVWDRAGRVVARTGISPNGITIISLILVVIVCIIYVINENVLLFGLLLLATLSLDNLDGAVARVTGRSSIFGSYLDATVDRYQEIAIFLALAHVNNLWLLSFLAITGSLMTSYTKARAGMEISVSNVAWPDFFERLERLLLLCIGLILDGFLGEHLLWGKSVLFYTIAIIATLSHVSAAQRFFRAKKILNNSQPPLS